MNTIAENYQKTLNRVKQAAEKSGRDPKDAVLIAVSKTKPLEDLREAYEAGARDFGENKVQELQVKIPAMPGDIRWHMIGHLQTNKVKYLIGKVYLIHSVDSLHLAKEISKESVKAGVTTDILMEVNVAQEESKYGISCEEVLPLVREIAALPGVRIRGLMTIAPICVSPEENRGIFRKLREISIDIKSKNIDNVSMDVLSMGMTDDFEVAVEEGASYVRVGTGIFGARNYNLS